MVRKKYSRQVIALNEEKTGYGVQGKSPFARCVLEINNDYFKTIINLQNIKNGYYEIYLISMKDSNSNSIGVKIGYVNVGGNKAEFKCRKHANNIMNSNLNIEDFGAIAVLDDNLDNVNGVLVGYMGEAIHWKNNFKRYNEIKDNIDTVHKKEDEKREYKIVSKKEIKIIDMEDKSDKNTSELKEENKKVIKLKQEEENIKAMKKEVTLEKKGIEEVKEDRDIEKEIKEEEIKATKEDEEIKEKEIEATREREEIKEEEIEATKEDEEIKEKEIEVTKEREEIKEEEIEATKEREEIKEEGIGVMAGDVHIDESDTQRENIKKAEKQNVSEENRHIDSQIDIDLEYILNNNMKMQPFKRQNKNVNWVILEIDDLITLPLNMWNYENNAFIYLAYYKNKHLILGREEGVYDEYYIGIPEQYMEEDKTLAEDLGFLQFKCCDDMEPLEGEYGYWLKKIWI